MYAKLAAAALPLLSVASGAVLPVRDTAAGCPVPGEDFKWKVTNFDYHASWTFSTPAHQNSWGYVSFNVSNPALGYTTSCSGTSNQLSDFFYGTQTYNCAKPEGSQESDGISFTWDYPGSKLKLHQTWVCHDDPQWPATFNAEGVTKVAKKCKDSGTKVNDKWELGQIYSTRTLTCDKVNFKFKPDTITGVAK